MKIESIKNGLNGKICLVTGATHGIGREIARVLAMRSAQLIIHGRNQSITEQTLAALKAESGSRTISLLVADFGDLDQVRQMAQDFKQLFSKLDILINNAGTFFLVHRKTPYGVEKTFLVNHLASFLLTNMLMEELHTSDSARIINVSSGSHRSAKLDLDDLTFKYFYNPFQAYARSKLANILFTYELTRRLEGSRITANAVHPGLVATNIWRSGLRPLDAALRLWMRRVALNVAEGADTPLYLASSSEVAGISGRYYFQRKAVRSSPETYDLVTARRLWEHSDRICSIETLS